MIPQPPPGQDPIDPRGAFMPPPAPGANQSAGYAPRPPMPPGMMPPPGLMPPPMMYPPPMFMPPPPPRGHGFFRTFASSVLVTLGSAIFVLSLALNVYLLITSGMLSGDTALSTTLISGDAHQKIAVIPIQGTIFDAMAVQFDRWMSAVEKDGDVKAIVLDVDSPGGSVTASDQIWHHIEQYKIEHPKVPVIVSMNGLAASGAFYISCAGDYLIAQPTALTGNIGVLLPQFNISKLFDKWGIQENTIVSTGATFKEAGSMFRPEKPEDRAYLQDIADKAFAQFKDVVAKGRQGKLKKPLDEIANGKIYTAADAESLGLIDQIGYATDAYAYAAKKAGLSNMTVVKYREPSTLLDALSGKSSVSPPQAGGMTINGINVDASAVRELMTPRLLYLWRGR